MTDKRIRYTNKPLQTEKTYRSSNSERCRFCKKTLGNCTCEEGPLGDYYNNSKPRDDPWG